MSVILIRGLRRLQEYDDTLTTNNIPYRYAYTPLSMALPLQLTKRSITIDLSSIKDSEAGKDGFKRRWHSRRRLLHIPASGTEPAETGVMTWHQFRSKMLTECRLESNMQPPSESTKFEGDGGFIEYKGADKLKDKKVLITGGEYVALLTWGHIGDG